MFRIFQENKNVSWILSQMDNIDFSPRYQRAGNVWNKKQKQLLIDSIINGLDIPKLYFQFMPKDSSKRDYLYAVIDGKQRLETIIGFIEDKFPLSGEFKYLFDEEKSGYMDIAGKKFSEIDSIEPEIAAKILNYVMCIVFIDTDNPDIINEIFIRLNSGKSVNSFEKRNAVGGRLSMELLNLCSETSFFTGKIALNNTRYAHLDLALKLLMIEMGYDDLSNDSLNEFVNKEKDFGIECRQALEKVKQKTERIAERFDAKDGLLAKKSIIITFYTVSEEIPEKYLKDFLEYFEKLRSESKKKGGTEESGGLMSEFTRHLQQGTDKKISLEKRAEIMREYLHGFLKERN